MFHSVRVQDPPIQPLQYATFSSQFQMQFRGHLKSSRCRVTPHNSEHNEAEVLLFVDLKPQK